MPPLRRRREDIEPLARHFLARFSAAETRGRVKAIAPRALAMLHAYDWPGNIRQLENAVFRATVLCDGDTLTEEEFPQIRAQVDGVVDLDVDDAANADMDMEHSAPARFAEAPVAASYEPPAEMGAGVLRGLDEQGKDDAGDHGTFLSANAVRLAA